MKAQELAAQLIVFSAKMLQNTLADFSDAEMLVRPCPAANHAAWQVGHLIAAQGRLTSAIGAESLHSMVPADFAAKFTKETSKIDDASAFPNKATLLELFASVNAATERFVKSLLDEALSRPMPEPMRHRLPDVAHAIMILGSHTTLHTGQFQVIRRKLGKPVLF